MPAPPPWPRPHAVRAGPSPPPPGHLESAQHGRHPPLQDIPAAVAPGHQGLQAAGGVGAALPGQTAVLLVDQLQLGQPLVHLPLETLERRGEGRGGG